MADFRFGRPEWLWLLWLIPVYLLVTFYSWSRFWKFDRWLQKKPYLYKKNLPPWWRRCAKALFYAIGITSIVLALADPHYQKAIPENVYKGIRIYFLFDISRSMEMCEDVKPNRLAAAKNEIKNSYDQFEGAYEVAIVPFAGEASPYYFPPSFNSLSFYLSLDFLNGDLIPIPGSDLIAAFDAVDLLVNAFGLRTDTVNMAVLLSDGGQDENSTLNRAQLQKAVKPLLDKKFRIYTIGIGGKEPTPLVKRDWAGNFEGYLTDKKTQRPYTSQIDEETLKIIANIGNGRYELFKQGGELKKTLEKIVEENRQLLEVKYSYREESARLWFFLAGITIFLFGELHQPRLKKARWL